MSNKCTTVFIRLPGSGVRTPHPARKKKMSLHGMKVALQLLESDQDSGESINPAKFREHYCKPIRAAELWLGKMKRVAWPCKKN